MLLIVVEHRELLFDDNRLNVYKTFSGLEVLKLKDLYKPERTGDGVLFKFVFVKCSGHLYRKIWLPEDEDLTSLNFYTQSVLFRSVVLRMRSVKLRQRSCDFFLYFNTLVENTAHKFLYLLSFVCLVTWIEWVSSKPQRLKYNAAC